MIQSNIYVLEGGASNQVQRIIPNLRSDAYFEYTSCYFKVVSCGVRDKIKE
jgi:hypothetical protein